MLSLDEAQGRYDAIRERDRVIASLQSKQRMVAVFEHLFDDAAREQVDTRLHEALDHVRAEARKLAIELARATFVELHIDDLGRVGAALRKLEAWLDAQPHERIDCCHDLLTFLRELDEIEGPLKPPVIHE